MSGISGTGSGGNLSCFGVTAGGDFLCCAVECPTVCGAVMSPLFQVALQITIADSQLDGPSRCVGVGAGPHTLQSHQQAMCE
jgi:hypothetical protein